MFFDFVAFMIKAFAVFGSIALVCCGLVIMMFMVSFVFEYFLQVKDELEAYKCFKRHAGLFSLWMREHPSMVKEYEQRGGQK